MTSTLGARLREQRERQGVALTTIAETTKIKASLLDELERDRLAHWPTGIFRRSYVRTYAEAIGLDPDVVLREFLSIYPDPVEEVSAVEAMVRTADGSGSRRPPTRLTYLLSSAMSALPSLLGPAGPHATMRAPIRTDDAVPVELRTPEQAGSQQVFEHDDAADRSSPPASSRPSIDDWLAHQGRPEPAFAEIALADAAFVPGEDPGSRVSERANDLPLPEFQLVPPQGYDPHTDLLSVSHDELARADDRARGTSRTASRIGTDRTRESQGMLDLVASLCTRLGQARTSADVSAVLQEATAAVNAVGIILWARAASSGALRPVLSHGYPSDLLAQIPDVTIDSDNAIGAAFRSAQTRIVAGNDQATGALAVPVMTPSGCAGVLAVEFRDEGEGARGVRGVLTILAAQLSMLVAHPVADPT